MHMIGFFGKNRSYIPGDNGSSLNILITIKISALTNKILIETSVLHKLFRRAKDICTVNTKKERGVV